MFVCLFVSLCDEDMWEFGALKTACSWQCVPYGHQLAQQSVHLLLRSLEDSSACVCSASLVLIRSCTHPDSKPVSMGWSYPTNLQIRWRCGQIMSLAFKVQDWSLSQANDCKHAAELSVLEWWQECWPDHVTYCWWNQKRVLRKTKTAGVMKRFCAACEHFFFSSTSTSCDVNHVILFFFFSQFIIHASFFSLVCLTPGFAVFRSTEGAIQWRCGWPPLWNCFAFLGLVKEWPHTWQTCLTSLQILMAEWWQKRGGRGEEMSTCSWLVWERPHVNTHTHNERSLPSSIWSLVFHRMNIIISVTNKPIRSNQSKMSCRSNLLPFHKLSRARLLASDRVLIFLNKKFHMGVHHNLLMIIISSGVTVLCVVPRNTTMLLIYFLIACPTWSWSLHLKSLSCRMHVLIKSLVLHIITPERPSCKSKCFQANTDGWKQTKITKISHSKRTFLLLLLFSNMCKASNVQYRDLGLMLHRYSTFINECKSLHPPRQKLKMCL